jgi:hypothetical protein
MANSESNQRRPGLWEIVNERYPGAMIRKLDAVPLAKLRWISPGLASRS